MQTGNQLGEFLRARRELLTPEDVGLPATGRRRIQGLRREEAALVAGISPEDYLRLEQGLETSPTEPVLEAITRALQLDDSAAAELRELAHPAPDTAHPQAAPTASPSDAPGLAAVIGSWTHQAAYIEGRLLGVLAANDLAIALSPAFAPGTNSLRSAFLDPATRELYADREAMLSGTVARLRTLIGPDIDDRELTQLVGELSVRSSEFRALWGAADAPVVASTTLRLRHPAVGDLELRVERLAIESSPGDVLVILHADAGSDSARALQKLEGGASGVSNPAAARSLPAPVPIESRRRLP